MTRLAIVLGAVCAWHTSASASLINGSFESGDHFGWITAGNVFVRDYEISRDFVPPVAPDWLPTDGLYFASLWSTNNDGVNSASLSQTFLANAGDELRFDYFFDYGDAPPYFDSAVGTLSFSGGPSLELFVHNTEPSNQMPASQNVDWSQTSAILPFSGSYSLTFVLQDSDGSFESILGIDNVYVVPEPAPILGFISLLIALVPLRRRS